MFCFRTGNEREFSRKRRLQGDDGWNGYDLHPVCAGPLLPQGHQAHAGGGDAGAHGKEGGKPVCILRFSGNVKNMISCTI